MVLAWNHFGCAFTLFLQKYACHSIYTFVTLLNVIAISFQISVEIYVMQYLFVNHKFSGADFDSTDAKFYVWLIVDALVIAGCIYSAATFIAVRSFTPVKLNLSQDNIAGFEPTPKNDFIEVSDGNLDFVLSFSTPLFVTIVIMIFNSYIDYNMTREDELILYCSLI